MDVTSVEKDESEKLVVTEEEKRKTIEFITEYLKEKKDRSQKEEKRVLKHMRPQSLYRVIERNTVFTNKEKMLNALIETGDIEYMYKAAILMKREDNIYISRIQDYIMKSGQVKYIIDFACNIQNADMDKLEDTIIALGDAQYIYEFLVKVMASKGKVNVEKLVNAIIAAKDAEYIYKLALALQLGFGIDYKSFDAERNIGFIEFVKDSASKSRIKASDDYVRKLENAMVNTYGNKFIGLFARDISGADVGRLENVIIDREDAVSAAMFPRYVKPQNLGAIEDIVIESNDSDIIYDYYWSVKNNCIDINRLVHALMKDKAGKWHIYNSELEFFLSSEEQSALRHTIHEDIKISNAKQLAKQFGGDYHCYMDWYR